MRVLAFILGLVIVLGILVDGFETILVPRRISHRFRFARVYYQTGWSIWTRTIGRINNPKARESLLSIFGPLSLLGLFVAWIACLILGFALLQWSLGVLQPNGQQSLGPTSFGASLYFSGTTCFTLGLGDVVPAHGFARALCVIEAGIGFGFLAVIISYLPVLYQAFSKREATISLMDARAGSPPTGGEFVRRLIVDGRIGSDEQTLAEWERWCAELLESQISFPVLAFYRSQHGNQSWLSSLTAMLDASALLLTLHPVDQTRPAQLTFAMARHAAVDLALIFAVEPPKQSDLKRSTSLADLETLLVLLGRDQSEAPRLESRFNELRVLYEPFLEALANRFLLTLPPVMQNGQSADNWQRSNWMSRAPSLGKLASQQSDDHFN